VFRSLTTLEAVEGAVVTVAGRRLVCWCSNDYLGLSQHPALVQAAAQAAAAFGVGARASRLLAGTTTCHRRLEESLAAWFGAEAALVFSSGYLANLGAIGSLASPQDAIVLDRMAHASLFEAARATRATVRVFRHNDADHAASVLARLRAARRRWLVTEGVFSMDGDVAPLAALAEVAQRQEALLYLDDAHGAFVRGAGGRGSPEDAGVSPERFLYMGALGKALGCQGGFVAADAAVIDRLRNRAKPFIYTTGLAVPVAAAAAAALRVLQDTPGLRARLAERVTQLHEALEQARIPASRTRTHIVPVLIGSAKQAVAVSQQLLDRGLLAPAIRPPTVPRGTARLRLSVTASHTPAHLAALVQGLRDACAPLAPLGG